MGGWNPFDEEPMACLSLIELKQQISADPNVLIVQDLDGVCMPLVRDPLTRVLPVAYVEAVAKLGHRFRVLTNGEHSSTRGVNRLVESALAPGRDPAAEGLYLPGLAAGGVQSQTRHGLISHPGVTPAELQFLKAVPTLLSRGVGQIIRQITPDAKEEEQERLAQAAVLDNELSPTLNLNVLFAGLCPEVEEQRQLQRLSLGLLQNIEKQAQEQGLADSFFVHLAPNLGQHKGQEQLKWASPEHRGTSDFQFMLRGAVKEAGLLVLLNQHIERSTGKAPLGADFNVRSAPRTAEGLLALAEDCIAPESMPTLIGIADTITSEWVVEGDQAGWRRGGSDRGFLTLLQQIGQTFETPNRVVLIDSSGGELDRPSLQDPELKGLSDPEDPLRLDVLVPGGPEAYVEWFVDLADNVF